MIYFGLHRYWSQAFLLAALCALHVLALASPLTEEECEAAGKRIAFLMGSGGRKEVIAMISFNANFERITDGLDLNERNLKLMKEHHRIVTTRELTRNITRYHNARFLRVQWIEGEKSVLIRLQNRATAEFNYLGCVLARDEITGEIKITDFIDYLLGESNSRSARETISKLLDAQAESVAKRAPEIYQTHLEMLDRVGTASDQVENRQFREALETLKGLPEKWRKQRSVLYLRFLSSQHVDHEESKQVTQDWMEAFPNDPSLDLSLSYTEEWLEEYDRAIRHIDSLAQRVGKDGRLSLRRAELCLKNNDPEGARLSAREALDFEPDLDGARLLLVKAALRAKDHGATLLAWRDFTLRFPRTDLHRLVESEAGFSDFIHSSEFQEWSAKR